MAGFRLFWVAFRCGHTTSLSSQPSSHRLGLGLQAEPQAKPSPPSTCWENVTCFPGKSGSCCFCLFGLGVSFLGGGRRVRGSALSQMPESVNSAPGKVLLTCRGGSGATRLTTRTPSGVVVRAWAQWESPPLGHVTSQGALGKSLKLQASVFPSVKWAWQRRPQKQEEDMFEAQSRPPEMLQPPALVWPRLCQQGGTISLSLIKALINEWERFTHRNHRKE